jgi:DASS family divalent anion:Na+ symporter
LALVNYHANPITSAMFITATAPNPLVVDLIAKATNSDIHLSWGTWALAMLLPGLVALVVMPIGDLLPVSARNQGNTQCGAICQRAPARNGPDEPRRKNHAGDFRLAAADAVGGHSGDDYSATRAAVDATTTAFIGLSAAAAHRRAHLG